MSDLVTWLRAQLDEDERVANEGRCGDSGRWFVYETDVWRTEAYFDDDGTEHHDLVVYGNVTVQSDHIAAWHPARVLAEVDAKRRILDLHEESDNGSGKADSLFCASCHADRYYNPDGRPMPCATVRLLALPYAGRDGYREEWRP